jgi:hypothetical protein
MNYNILRIAKGSLQLYNNSLYFKNIFFLPVFNIMVLILRESLSLKTSLLKYYIQFGEKFQFKAIVEALKILCVLAKTLR